MPKQKIMHLSQATGGVKTYVAHVIDFADKNLFEFVVLAPSDKIFEKFCDERSVKYFRADFERGLNPLAAITEVIKITRIIKKEKPSLLHVHSAKGGFLGRIAGKITRTKVIYTPHAFSYLSFTGFKRILFYLLELTVRNWTTLLLAISNTEANCAIYELGYPLSKVEVVLNSLPISNKQHTFSSSNKDLKIRMIGRLTKQKNPLLFITIARDLIEKYPHLKFSILGAGIHDELRTELENFLAAYRLKEKITIESWGDVQIGKAFLENTDIYLSTSVFEGLPFSLLEAMLLGKACIVSKVNGNTDVIQNGENGYSCLTIREFKEKLELLINDEELRKKIGKAGHDYIISYHNIETNIKNLEDIYLRTIIAESTH